MNAFIMGFGLIVIAAFLNGLFPLPLRLRRRYEVENTMMLAMGIATILLPMLVVQFTFPNWFSALSQVGWRTVAIIASLGLAWGLGSVTYGFGIAWLGLSLGFAIIMGIITAVGSTMPMLRRWETIPWDAKGIILLGLAICILGVGMCGKAGVLRDREDVPASGPKRQSKFVAGLAVCVISGLLSASNNLAFDYSEPIGVQAAHMGISPLFATLPRWLPIFWGGYTAIFVSLAVKMAKDGTYKKFWGAGAGHDFALASGMGAVHFVIVTAYGMATVYLGSRLGTSVGYAIFVASSIMVANALGFITGEWRTAPRSAIRTLYVGLGVLTVAIVLLSAASTLVP